MDAAEAVQAALETLYPRSWAKYAEQPEAMEAWTAEVVRRAKADPWKPILYHAQDVIGGDGGSYVEAVPESPIQPWPENVATISCARCRNARLGYIRDETLFIPFEHKLEPDGNIRLRHKLVGRVAVIPLGRHRSVGALPHLIQCPRRGHANRLLWDGAEWHAGPA